MVSDFLELVWLIPDTTPHLFKKLCITSAPFNEWDGGDVVEFTFASVVTVFDAVVNESDADANVFFDRSFSLIYINNSFQSWYQDL